MCAVTAEGSGARIRSEKERGCVHQWDEESPAVTKLVVHLCTLRSLRQDHKLKASLGYIGGSGLARAM